MTENVPEQEPVHDDGPLPEPGSPESLKALENMALDLGELSASTASQLQVTHLNVENTARHIERTVEDLLETADDMAAVVTRSAHPYHRYLAYLRRSRSRLFTPAVPLVTPQPPPAQPEAEPEEEAD